MGRLWARVREISAETFAEWRQRHPEGLGAALAFYGAVAIAGLSLIAVYVGGTIAHDRGTRAFARGETAHASGTHNAQFLDTILREAATRHDTWVALVAGGIIFVLAIFGTAFQLQRVLDEMWDDKPGEQPDQQPVRQARRHVPQFALIFGLSFVLIVLLLAGAGIHGLMSRTHRVSIAAGMLYQGLDVGVSIAVLTLLFLCIFAYLPPHKSSWKNAWPAAFVSATLYERGQFALAVYIGQMDAKSPYADAGALIAVLLWLFYSAQIVLIGAALTKVLERRGTRRAEKRSAA